MKYYLKQFYLSFLFFLPLADFLYGKTVIVNLSDKKVYAARQYYSEGSSSISVGDYRLPAGSSRGWYHRGWVNIEPGEALVTDPTNIYLKYDKSHSIDFPGLEVSYGYVKHGSKFPDGDSGFLSAGPQRENDVRKLRERGYEQVEFRKFSNGTYTIGASHGSYQLKTKEFDVNLESRSINFLLERYQVPGRVVHYEFYQSENKWTRDISWGSSSSQVTLTGSMEGRQVRVGGPREPAKYKGSLKVWYTIRK